MPEGARGLVKDLRVRWALEEAGLDYRVRLLGGERPAEYCQDQPFNQVPCLSDGTVRIFESGAILQYIGEKSEALLPSEPQAKFRAIQWTYAAVSSLEPFVQFRVAARRRLRRPAMVRPGPGRPSIISPELRLGQSPAGSATSHGSKATASPSAT